jgi:hypothetical protein
MTHGQILRESSSIDWKRQFKIRSNWERGSARFQELEIAKPPTPPVLARVHGGLVFTVDLECGVRIWSRDHPTKQLHAQVSIDHPARPHSLAIDGNGDDIRIAVGLGDGHFLLYRLATGTTLELLLNHSVGSDVAISSIAIAGQYVLTMSDNQRMSLYRLGQDRGKRELSKMTSLHAQSTPNVSSLGLRLVSSTVYATICYVFYELSVGWCIGLQEIKIHTGLDAEDLKSDSTTSGDQRTQCIEHQIDSRCASSAAIRSPFTMQLEINGVPTSISYSHPYLLASLRDNTIMSYTVTSTNDKLEISAGRRLWGHTSAVSRAEVSPRGKAVSMSVKGQDIHVWELEEILRPTGQRSFHIPVVPSHTPLKGSTRGTEFGSNLHGLKKDLAITRNWVGFDDEQVVVLGEQEDQRQIMTCYDFT